MYLCNDYDAVLTFCKLRLVSGVSSSLTASLSASQNQPRLRDTAALHTVVALHALNDRNRTACVHAAPSWAPSHPYVNAVLKGPRKS